MNPKQLKEDVAYEDANLISFIEEMKIKLPDCRDSRGKRHNQVLVITGVLLGMLSGRCTLSGIHRFIVNRLNWLSRLTKIKAAKSISRAQLPRLLDRMDWVALDKIINRFFGVKIMKNAPKTWFAVDGKALRGSQSGDDRQSMVFAVDHVSRETVGVVRQIGTKSSEIPAVRTLLKENGLESQKITVDAHHCNPETTAQIHQANGVYLVQVKENQPGLLKQCQQLAAISSVLASQKTHDKAHGRVTSRDGVLFSMAQEPIDARWEKSGIATLVVITRESYASKKKTTTTDTSYYVSNQPVNSGDDALSEELIGAIQQHWSVESNNWIRDVTFREDEIKVKAGNQGQIMGRLRGLVIELIRRTKATNLQAAVEQFMDSPPNLVSMLKQVNFL